MVEKKASSLISVTIALLTVAAVSTVARAVSFEKKPYLQHVTQTSIIICWETDFPAPAEIRFGTTKDLEHSVQIPASDTFNEVHLKDLQPGTEYLYILKTGEEKMRGKFKTAPEAGAPFRAIVYGDFRVGPVENSLNKKMAKKEPDIYVTVGDYLSDGKDESLWPYMFRTIAPLITKTPYYVTLGNHENDSPIYFKYFAMPGNERWFSFDYSNVHFVYLDSNPPYITRPEQTEWLKKDLAAANENEDVDFVFAVFHHPPFGTGKRHGYEAARKQWVPIFEEYEVDAVFSGHEHFYERCEVNGIKYITSGGGGAALYEFVYDEDYSLVRASRFQYLQLDVDGDTIKAKSIALEGDLLDEFEMKSKR